MESHDIKETKEKVIKKQSTEKKEPVSHEKELEQLRSQNKEYLDTLQRLQAEFDNYRKRIQKEQEEKQKYVHVHLLQKLLLIVDTFEQALKTMKTTDEHMKGVQLMYHSLLKTLKEEGVVAMDVVGKAFHPGEHEVVAKQKSDKEEGIILEVIQKGYLYKDKILRHAKVVVSSGKN